MGERRARRRADPDAAKDTRSRGVVEFAPEVVRASINPEPADVVRRSAALGGNAAALRTARALGFAGGDLAADAYTGEEPPDFFFGTLADLDVPIAAAPQSDSPPSARAAFTFTVTGPAAPSRPAGGTGGDGGEQGPQPAELAAEPAVDRPAAGATDPGARPEGLPTPSGPPGAVARVSGGAPAGVSTSSAAAPATAVG